jgi:hypothetical protein
MERSSITMANGASIHLISSLLKCVSGACRFRGKDAHAVPSMYLQQGSVANFGYGNDDQTYLEYKGRLVLDDDSILQMDGGTLEVNQLSFSLSYLSSSSIMNDSNIIGQCSRYRYD